MPTALNWPQARRLVEAARRWRAWEPPTQMQVNEIASGRLGLSVALPSHGLAPPSQIAPPEGYVPPPSAGRLWKAHPPDVHHAPTFGATFSAGANAMCATATPRSSWRGSGGGRGGGGGSVGGSGGGGGRPERSRGGGASGRGAVWDGQLQHDLLGSDALESSWVLSGRSTAIERGPAPSAAVATKEDGSLDGGGALPFSLSARSSPAPAGEIVALVAEALPALGARDPASGTDGPSAPQHLTMKVTHAPAATMLPTAAATAGDGSAGLVHSARGRPRPKRLEELGAMKVAVRPDGLPDTKPALSARTPRGGGSTGKKPSSAVAPDGGLAPPLLAAASAIAMGLGSDGGFGTPNERTAFVGNALFTGTQRRREKTLSKRRRDGHGHSTPRGDHHPEEPLRGDPIEPAAQQSEGSAPSRVAPLQAAMLGTPLQQHGGEGHYSRMDHALLDELASIAFDEMKQPFNPRRNRKLRNELALLMQTSRHRVSTITHETFDPNALTPTSARAALKDGVRTPLELVRSELRQRYPYRRQTHAAHTGRAAMTPRDEITGPTATHQHAEANALGAPAGDDMLASAAAGALELPPVK
jgi:hypothetical protein